VAACQIDELLAQQISMRKYYASGKPAAIRRFCGRTARCHTAVLVERLPFHLTCAQERVERIEGDLAQPHPMHAVARGRRQRQDRHCRARRVRAVENGLQTAVMAPTEILAEQHFRKFSEWLALGAGSGVAPGARQKGARIRACRRCGREKPGRNRHACAIPGTGSVRSLGLAVVDEQHRLALRSARLRAKGAESHQS